MTNYEKIKTMTEDELTSFLAEPRCRHCDHGGEWEHCEPARHETGIRRWLEMKAERRKTTSESHRNSGACARQATARKIRV